METLILQTAGLLAVFSYSYFAVSGLFLALIIKVVLK